MPATVAVCRHGEIPAPLCSGVSCFHRAVTHAAALRNLITSDGVSTGGDLATALDGRLLLSGTQNSSSMKVAVRWTMYGVEDMRDAHCLQSRLCHRTHLSALTWCARQDLDACRFVFALLVCCSMGRNAETTLSSETPKPYQQKPG
jgi:hypothetical protein